MHVPFTAGGFTPEKIEDIRDLQVNSDICFHADKLQTHFALLPSKRKGEEVFLFPVLTAASLVT